MADLNREQWILTGKAEHPMGIKDFFMQLNVKEQLEQGEQGEVNRCPRYAGKTTIRVMALIATAMQNSGREYPISDVPRERNAIRDHMVPMMKDIINRVGLQGFDIYCKDDGNWYVMFTEQ